MQICLRVLHEESVEYFADIVSETSEQLCNWLMNASVFQSPNPYTLNPFRKDASSQVTEIDGTPCRNVFTILNVGEIVLMYIYWIIYLKA